MLAILPSSLKFLCFYFFKSILCKYLLESITMRNLLGELQIHVCTFHNSEFYANIHFSFIAYTAVDKITALQTKLISYRHLMILESYFLSQKIALSYSLTVQLCCNVKF